jgi:uncharacterized protein
VTASQQPNYVNPRVLKINVGFLLAESAGYQREIALELPRVRLADDVDVDYLRGGLQLSRNTHGILVRGRLEMPVITECSRCLAPTAVPVTLEIEELFSFPASSDTTYSVDESGILDLAPLLREEAILAVPMVVLCRSDCAGLCPECGQNWNEGACDCHQDEIDPRFAVLAQLTGDDQSDE